MTSWLRSAPNSTARLLQYAFLYFALYAAFGVLVKYFQSPAAQGYPGMSDLHFLVYSTGGSALICLGVIFARSWWKFKWQAREIGYMFLAGTFTAMVIPTTKLMYTLPISVMVAMILMRGSIIVLSRIVDSVLLLQGISDKKVSWEENAAMLISLAAVAINILFAKAGDFEFLKSTAAMVILSVYLVGYGLRLYLMNYFKFTRTGNESANNKNYFAIEQLAASFWIFGFVGVAIAAPGSLPGTLPIAEVFHQPHPLWLWAMAAGLPFGVGAFFSAFLFLFQGRTSTFAGLVNRLSSLIAGTASTLIFAAIFGGSWPSMIDWAALSLILIAVWFLARAEGRRTSASHLPLASKI